MKALIVDGPWISAILRDEKAWEMRKTRCKLGGYIALIRKGSGHVIGVPEVTGSLSSRGSREAYAPAEPFHRVPPSNQRCSFAVGWRTPWVLANARPLPKAVPYKHPAGAVIWAYLGPETTPKVETQAQ
jgi:hypothetical protein